MDDFKWRLSWYAATFLLVPTLVILTFALVTEKFHWFITWYWHRARCIFLWLFGTQCLLGTTSLALYTRPNCELLGFELSSATVSRATSPVA